MYMCPVTTNATCLPNSNQRFRRSLTFQIEPPRTVKVNAVKGDQTAPVSLYCTLWWHCHCAQLLDCEASVRKYDSRHARLQNTRMMPLHDVVPWSTDDVLLWLKPSEPYRSKRTSSFKTLLNFIPIIEDTKIGVRYFATISFPDVARQIKDTRGRLTWIDERIAYRRVCVSQRPACQWVFYFVEHDAYALYANSIAFNWYRRPSWLSWWKTESTSDALHTWKHYQASFSNITQAFFSDPEVS